MNINQKEIGQRIAKLRLEKGFTQEKLARIINISTEHLGRIETGKRCISIELLTDLSCFFDVSTDYILLGKIVTTSEIKTSLKQIIYKLSEIEKGIN
ncbi:MAG: helix-turn-helix transcriptional regulator [Oscillospiraceae bacterium]|nr:helix-turn-helix transcriptional regulator [Oscillospiraceae bacterium]